jgi:imidazolonepropionase-like amidohydrolase
VYDAITSEARARGIRVVGHVDPEVGVARALAAGQQIEHLDNYLESVLADSAPMRESVSDRGLFRLKNWESLDYVDDAKVERIAGATARAGIFTCPTLTVFKTAFALGQSEKEIKARPDWRIMPAELRGLYLQAREKYWAKPATEARRMRWVQVRDRLVKAIADSGGKIMAGSDTPEWFFGYGWTLHRELESLVAAGLTPYQALAAATRNPAEFLRASSEWGTIEPGKRADLVLVTGNPLEDIRNTARIEGVAVGGRWLDPRERERMIGEAMKRLGA